MKKIVGIMGAAAMLASSVFAVDFSARVYMTGDIANGKIDTTKDEAKPKQNDSNVNFFKLNAQDQKDADALVLSANMGNAGAQFQFWYNYDGKDDAASSKLEIRNTNLWFKPVDAVKVTVGDVSVNMGMGETLHYWKDPVGASLADWKSWGAKYQGYATVEGAGFNLDVNPIPGLSITCGVTPGAGAATLAASGKTEDTDNNLVNSSFDMAKWGIGASYDLSVGGKPLTIAASWRDEGYSVSTIEHKLGTQYVHTIKPKVLAVGAKYGARYGAGFYGLLNARLRFEQDSRTNPAVTSIALNGMTLDNHFKYAAGKFEAQLRAPVTFRFAKVYETKDGKEVVKKDVNGKEVYEASYLCWSAKVSYNMGSFTPYALFGSDLDNDGAWKFSAEKNEGFLDTMNFEIQPGVTFNVGACALDIGLRLNLNAGTFTAGQAMYDKEPLYDSTAKETAKKAGADITWSIPVTMSVAF